MQVSRLGNPLVNEVVIPLGQKDRFNRTTPDDDAANYGKFVTKPELAAVLNALFGINAPENDRTDIVQALLQGIPGLNQHSGQHAGKPVDTLKINLGVPPTARTAAEPVRRDRRRQRRVPERPPARSTTSSTSSSRSSPDILVGNKVPLGDGVDKNDKKFLSKFPYLAAPDSGFDSNPSQRFEPAHPPTPPGGP